MFISKISNIYIYINITQFEILFFDKSIKDPNTTIRTLPVNIIFYNLLLK